MSPAYTPNPWEAHTLTSEAEPETFNLLIQNIPRDLFFKTRELKAKYQCDTWLDFLQKVNDLLKEVPDHG